MAELLKKKIRDELLAPSNKKKPFIHVVDQTLHDHKIASKLQNLILKEAKPNTKDKNTLKALEDLRTQFIASLEHSLFLITDKATLPLMRVNSADAPPLVPCDSQARFRGLYDADHLLELITSMKHPNASDNSTKKRGIMPLRLRPVTLGELADTFDEFKIGNRHLGVDDSVRGWFTEERYRMAQRVLQDGYQPIVTRFLRCGAPLGLRGALWREALGVTMGPQEAAYYMALTAEVRRVSLVIDEAINRDCASPLAAEDYFVFSEQVNELALCFVRDSWIAENSRSSDTLHVIANGLSGRRYLFPPNGSLPPCGLSQYFMPLCYCYANVDELYFVARSLWVQYWSRLHSISSHSQTLIPLVHLFEHLIHNLAPELCDHLVTLNVHPTRVAFPWILYAFSAYLPAEQVLLVWDRIIGYDSLVFLPLLAAAIFLFRSRSLMAAIDTGAASRILADATEIRAIPLLQALLSSPSSLSRKL